MTQQISVHELKKGDQIEFHPEHGPKGRHTVLLAWGVTGRNGPIEPWIVTTKDDTGRVHNLKLEPRIVVLCHSRRPPPLPSR